MHNLVAICQSFIKDYNAMDVADDNDGGDNDDDADDIQLSVISYFTVISSLHFFSWSVLLF